MHARRLLAREEHKISQRIQQARARAHDKQWLATADLLQVGPIWAAAAATADTEPTAAAALRKCEDRLRVLHPYAMEYYDMCREDDARPLDAMLETAPMFGRAPHVQVSNATASGLAPAATASAGQALLANADAGQLPEPAQIGDAAERTEYQARQLAQQLQDRARAGERPPFERHELMIVLETITSLPGTIIEAIACEAENTARTASGPAQLAADSFPDVAYGAASATSAAESRTLDAQSHGSHPSIS